MYALTVAVFVCAVAFSSAKPTGILNGSGYASYNNIPTSEPATIVGASGVVGPNGATGPSGSVNRNGAIGPNGEHNAQHIAGQDGSNTFSYSGSYPSSYPNTNSLRIVYQPAGIIPGRNGNLNGYAYGYGNRGY